jgi:hypothetical protein
MKKFGLIVEFLIVGLFIASANTAQAYTYAISGAWDAADGVEVGNSVNGLLSNAVGAPDTNDTVIGDGDLTNDRFLSLGRGGAAVFDFGVDFSGEAVIYEATRNRGLNLGEKAAVYVADSSFDFSSFAISFGTDTSDENDVSSLISTSGFTKVTDINNNGYESIISLTGTYRYMLIVDSSGRTWGDGFDIDAVGVTAVPEPSTVLLLVCGLSGLAAMGRKKFSKIHK